jgi:sugar O-acyltransferase (sialic acid O-acetyltransferase NeuD family)
LKSLVIIGAGGHASVVADAAQCAHEWRHISFFDDRWPALATHAGLEVVGNLDALRERLSLGWPGDTELVVAVGDNTARMRLSMEFSSAGARLATVVHPSAVVSASATLGAGTVVFARAVVNPACVIGKSCIVNTGAVVDHNANIGDGVHICPGVALAGNVSVGELTWVGIGSCVIQGVRIGARATVGAGAAVIRNVEAGATVVGNPARKIRSVS